MAATVEWSASDIARKKELEKMLTDADKPHFKIARRRRIERHLRDLNERYEQLPYDFDLLYDIKNVAQLRHELACARKKAESLEDMIIVHDIKLEDTC